MIWHAYEPMAFGINEYQYFLGQINPAKLELLLPTWIYFCWSEGTTSFTRSFTANVTIPTSISQPFRSWVAIFHLSPSMTCLSQRSYDMPGLAALMNASEGDFRISVSGRDMSGHDWNSLVGIYMVDMGKLSNNMKSPYTKCYIWHFGARWYAMTPHHTSSHYTN